MNTQRQNLTDILQWRGERQPHQLAFRYLADGEAESATLDYGSLDREAQAIAAALQEVCWPGDRVLLLFPAGLDYIRAFVGCLYAGCVSVTAYPPKPRRSATDSSWQRLQAIAADADARVVLTTSALLERLHALQQEIPALGNLCWIAVDTLLQKPAKVWQPPNLTPETLAFLQYTSGSTATPKGVMVSHGNLMHNLEQVHRGLRTSSESTLVGWLPLFHDMGLIGMMLHALYVGIPYIFFSPAAFVQKPLRWLEAISRCRGTTSGAPNFAYDLCVDRIAPEERERLDLSCWNLAFSGAEPVRADTLARFADAYRPYGFQPDAFNPCYGLAEATLVVSIGFQRGEPVVRDFDAEALEQRHALPATADSRKARALVGCGTTVDDQRTEIVDPETRELCPPGAIGEIWIQGPSVAQGYWRRPEETRATFQASLADGVTGPFLRTGDLGFCHEGQLYLSGRLKDMLIIRGANHYPQDIETTVERCHPALRPSGCAAFSIEAEGEERLVVAQELQRTALQSDLNAVYAAIRAAIAEEHGLEAHAIVLLKPGGITKTTSGKIQRSACRAAWLEGSLSVVGTALASGPSPQSALTPGPSPKLGRGERAALTPAHDIETWLARRLARHLRVPSQEIRPDMTFAQYGLDSAVAVGLTGELQEWLGQKLAPTLFYEYPTIRLLARHLAGESVPTHSLPSVPVQEPIAIVGMGCRFPGGVGDPESYWQLLANGVDAVTRVPSDRWDGAAWYDADPTQPARATTQWGGFLEQVDGFDPAFFGISPREASRMDPQQRLLLEVAWDAMEDAGLRLEPLQQGATGVYVGAYNSDYFWMQLADPGLIDPYTSSGSAHSILANRLSYFMDLRGPSLSVDTACSSSLVAVHLACQGLRGRECNTAFAGAVNLMLSPLSTVVTSKTLTMAADGRCKAFDASADGIVRGEGCGVIVLKRLADAQADGDRILAVIRGSAVNQDGRTNGLTAPNGLSQQKVIRQALAAADVAPAQVGYIEAHGTGTTLGDPIEMEALQAVYERAEETAAPCFVGSVKTNLGHLEAAAGLAGLMKTVLALQHQVIPPHLHFQRWNPHIAVKEAQFAIPRRCVPWQAGDRARYAGVSSFGFGGTNAHLILGEAPTAAQVASTAEAAPPYLLPISAADAGALRERARAMQRFLLESEDASLADVCYTAGAKRNHLSYRVAVVGNSREALAAQLAAFTEKESGVNAAPGERPKLAFVFSGQGTQWATMGVELMAREPIFRSYMEEFDLIYREQTGESLLAEIAADAEQSRLHRTEIAQPALMALQVALAGLLWRWGIEPDAVVGHSMGEIAAACSVGALSFQDAMWLIVQRGRLMAKTAGQGKMVAVSLGAEALTRFLQGRDDVTIAAVNGPNAATLSGDAAAVVEIVEALRAEKVRCQLLPGDCAFHSRAIEAIGPELRHRLDCLRPQPETAPLYSTVTGRRMSGSNLDADYWFANARQPVLFAPAMRTLISEGYRCFVEIAPQPALSHYILQCLEQERQQGSAVPCLRQGKEIRTLLTALGDLYAQGQPIRWERLAPAGGRLLSLPRYPFQRQRCWLPSSDAALTPPSATALVSERAFAPLAPARPEPPSFVLPAAPEAQLPALEAYLHTQVQRVLGLPPERTLLRDQSLATVGLDSLMVIELKNRVEKDLKLVVPTGLLMEGPSIAQVVARLRDQLAASTPAPQAVVSLTPSDVADLSDAEVDRMLALVMQKH